LYYKNGLGCGGMFGKFLLFDLYANFKWLWGLRKMANVL